MVNQFQHDAATNSIVTASIEKLKRTIFIRFIIPALIEY